MAHTAAKRIEVFERLAWNGGNVVRTARETGVPRQTISNWLGKHADEYAAVVDATREKLLKQVINDRSLAMDALREALNVKRAMMRDPRERSKVRLGDIARALDILDRIARLENDQAKSRRSDDADAETEADVRRDVAAILGTEG